MNLNEVVSGVNLPDNIILSGVPGDDGRGIGFPRLQGMISIKHDPDQNLVVYIEIYKLMHMKHDMSNEEKDQQESFLLMHALIDFIHTAKQVFNKPVFKFSSAESEEEDTWTVVDDFPKDNQLMTIPYKKALT